MPPPLSPAWKPLRRRWRADSLPKRRRTRSRRSAGWTRMLRVEELDRLLVDLHVLAVRNGRRLGRAHEMAPAPRKAGGVELLEGGLMVLEGVHLGEVVVHANRGQTADERIRGVPEVGILLRQIHGLLYLGHGAHLREVGDLRPIGRRLRVDALLER